jgi:hypothetical protein
MNEIVAPRDTCDDTGDGLQLPKYQQGSGHYETESDASDSQAHGSHDHSSDDGEEKANSDDNDGDLQLPRYHQSSGHDETPGNAPGVHAHEIHEHHRQDDVGGIQSPLKFRRTSEHHDRTSNTADDQAHEPSDHREHFKAERVSATCFNNCSSAAPSDCESTSTAVEETASDDDTAIGHDWKGKRASLTELDDHITPKLGHRLRSVTITQEQCSNNNPGHSDHNDFGNEIYSLHARLSLRKPDDMQPTKRDSATQTADSVIDTNVDANALDSALDDTGGRHNSTTSIRSQYSSIAS